jgi:hypothetical protein
MSVARRRRRRGSTTDIVAPSCHGIGPLLRSRARAIAGATGWTGRYVVEELLSRNVPVLATVRDIDRANDVLDPRTNTSRYSGPISGIGTM